MTEDELKLFSEFLEQKEFNSKAQKARRRKWDIEQGLGSDTTSSFNPTSLTDRTTIGMEGKLQNEAISQAKLLGKEKTIDLLDKSTKNTKTLKDGFFKTRTTTATTRQELKEMENAQNLIRAGRQRSRDNWSSLFERNILSPEQKKESFNKLINKRGRSFILRSGFRKYDSKKALRDLYESRTNPLLRDGKVTKLRKLAKAKNKKVGKIAGIGAGIAGTAALGTVAYKKIKKNKDKKKED